MPTLEHNRAGLPAAPFLPTRPKPGWAGVAVWLVALALMATACKKDAALQAMDSDANGYLCLKCGVKLCTDRAVFIGPQCPKCKQEALMDVVGYECPKDHHLTIRPKRGDSQPLACEQCQGPLVNAMKAPRETDLKAWGATKTGPQDAR